MITWGHILLMLVGFAFGFYAGYREGERDDG